MFDYVRNNKKIVQVFLVLITLPFALWGVDSYINNAGTETELATVGELKITAQDLQIALREQQERMRAQMGGQMDPAMFQTPEVRRSVLDSLVNQRLMTLHAQKQRLSINDVELARFITSVPSLQENGVFSKQRYEAVVASQGLSKEGFEARLRQDLSLQQLVQPVTEAGIVGQLSSQRWAAAQTEQREVAELRLTPEAYLSQVKLEANAVSAYYEANRKQFEVPEQIRVEYLVLGQQDFLAQVAVSEDEIKARYQSKMDSYKQGETRRASHILLRADKQTSADDLKALHARADELLAQVRKTPADFAKLAKQFSQDPGSAEKGGDLDWFGRGMMVKPFEDAVFALKEGQISDVVQSDFGFHIIRATGVRAERVKPLDEVKVEILAELKNEAGNKKFVEAAEAFTNTVYEQADSLQPAAEKWKLTLRNTDWVSKGAPLPAPLNNPKLAAALFADDAVKNKRNTEAVEAAPGTLVSARVLDYKPAALRPLDAVKAEIETRLTREEAVKLAAKDGEAQLARLHAGEALTLKWSPVRSVSRLAPQGLAQDALRAVFKADSAKLPAHVGVALPGGYALYRVAAVKAGDAADPRVKALAQQYSRLVAEEEFQAWMALLKQRYPVKINTAALEKKEG